MNNAPIYLHAAGAEAKPALTLGQAYPKTRNGIPCFYYWRQAIADGEYVHPTKKFRLSVDAKRRKTWEDNFRRMATHGEEAPVVEDHEDTKSRATLGYVVDVRQNGRWYEELHQYLGEQSRDTALKNKISVGIDPDFATGNGVKLGDCIIHSATTPRPIVPGQGEAVLAASRGPAGDVLELAAPDTKESDMDISALRTAIGAAATVPDADVITQAATKLGTLPTLEQAKATAESERDTARQELSRRPAPSDGEFPKAVAASSVNLLSREIELMAREGSISGEQATAAKALIGTADKPNTLMLSREGANHPAEAWFKVLALGKSGIKADGTAQTGVQTLARPTHDHSAATNLGREDGKQDPAAAVAAAREEGKTWQSQQLANRGLSA